jgi:hypothetical protein
MAAATVPRTSTTPPAPAAPPPAPTAPKPPMRYVAWTCDECGSPNRTRSRTGDRMTCPKCEHVQMGPEAKAKHEAKLARIRKRQAAATATTPSTSKRVRVRGQAPPAEPATTPAAPPPAPEPKRELGWFDRALGYGSA